MKENNSAERVSLADIQHLMYYLTEIIGILGVIITLFYGWKWVDGSSYGYHFCWSNLLGAIFLVCYACFKKRRKIAKHWKIHPYQMRRFENLLLGKEKNHDKN